MGWIADRTCGLRVCALLIIALGAIACVDPKRIVGAEFADEVESMHAMLFRQSDAWNRGDIETFMGAYWQSPELTFSSGGETTQGWEETLARYRKRYPDRVAMGTLTFSALETQMLGPDAAFTLGQWQLERDDPVRGNFTLVWRKIKGSWRIIHDHSSALKSP
jgi:ketosteroid isomerase-like protein